MAVVGTAVLELLGETAQYRGEVEGAARRMRRLGSEMETLGARAAKSGAATQAAARLASRAMIALGGALGVREVVNYADSWKLIEGRLRLVTDSTQGLARVQEDLFSISQRSRTSYEATAELYARVARNADSLGRSEQELLDFTEAVQKSVQLSGATAQEATAGVIQLSQGLAAGALRGDEFRSVSEQLPGILAVIRQATGKTAGELREMAFAGELTADLVIGSMLKMKDSIDKDFQSVPRTVGQAMTVLRNEVMKFIGGADNATDASANMAAGIVKLSENIGGVTKAALVVVGVLTSRWLRGHALAHAAQIQMTKQVLLGNAVLLDSAKAHRLKAVAAADAAKQEALASAQRVKSLEVELAGLRALQVEERRLLAASVARLKRAVDPVTLAPLGGRVVAREQAALLMAEQQRAKARAQLNTLQQRAVAIETELAATTKASTAASATAVTAQRAAAAATAFTTRAMALATTVARGMWAAIGGPFGLALLGLWGIYELVQRSRRQLQAMESDVMSVAEAMRALDDEQRMGDPAARLKDARAVLQAELDLLRQRTGFADQNPWLTPPNLAESFNADRQQAKALETQIVALNKRIKELGGPDKKDGGFGEDIQKIIDNLATSIRSAAVLNTLFGDSFDYTAERASIYRNAVEELVTAGVSLNAVVGPQGETLRQLADKFLDLDAAVSASKEAEKVATKLKEDAARVTADLLTPMEERNQTEAHLKGLLDANAITQDTYNRGMAEAKRIYEETTPAGKRMAELLDEQKRLLASIETPQQAYNRGVALAKELLAAGLITLQQYSAELARLKAEQPATARASVGMQLLADSLTSVGTSAADAMASLVGHAERAGEVFSQFAAGVLADISRIIARLIALKAVAAILNFVSPGSGTAFAAANGLTARASGGPVMANHSYLVGEKGPELFTPKGAGNIVPNAALAGGGTLRLDVASLPPRPAIVTPDAVATDDWWRRAFSALSLDYADRGGL
jgi:tape measure domain-containing protein